MGFKLFFDILGCDAHLQWIFAEIYQDNLRRKLYWCYGASHEH